MAVNLLKYVKRLPSKNFTSISAAKSISTTSIRKIIEIEENVKGNTISISGKISASDRAHRLVCVPNDHKACPLCRLGLKVTFSDVLILEQFMRSDGTVLPPDVTGLCHEQQTHMERCVQQAHWSGLFPSNKPKGYAATVEEVGYKQYKRYWNTPEEMFERKYDLRPGSWFYIRRY